MPQRLIARLLLVGLIVLPTLVSGRPVSANVTRVVLHRRTCSAITVYAVYDGFSGGVAPFYAVLTADLDDDGVFGEAGEPIQYVRLNTTVEEQYTVSARLTFRSVREGTTIGVTAYEIDNTATTVSAPLEPVRFECTNRPAFDPLPPNTGIAIPGVGVTTRVTANSVNVYSGPSADTVLLGALGRFAIVNVTGRNQRGDWARIEFQGGTGWIMWQTQVDLIGPYTDLPIIE